MNNFCTFFPQPGDSRPSHAAHILDPVGAVLEQRRAKLHVTQGAPVFGRPGVSLGIDTPNSSQLAHLVPFHTDL